MNYDRKEVMWYNLHFRDVNGPRNFMELLTKLNVEYRCIMSGNFHWIGLAEVSIYTDTEQAIHLWLLEQP